MAPPNLNKTARKKASREHSIAKAPTSEPSLSDGKSPRQTVGRRYSTSDGPPNSDATLHPTSDTSVSPAIELDGKDFVQDQGIKRDSVVKSALREEIDATFRQSADLRQAVTENLAPLRRKAAKTSERVEKAFEHWKPVRLSEEDRRRGLYVPPEADTSETLKTLFESGVDALRATNSGGAIRLPNSPELKQITQRPRNRDDSVHGVVQLGPLIDLLYSKRTAISLVSSPVCTRSKAESDAEKILNEATTASSAKAASAKSNFANSQTTAREIEQFVTDSVHRQMDPATAPETRLEYGTVPKIPNTSGEDEVQKELLDTFALRPGPSDVTSYHDFHTLQIAFANVWTKLFDGELEALGRELYGKYVDLKAFTGSHEPDIAVSTLDDLKRLMGEIKKLTDFVEVDTHVNLPGIGGGNGSSAGGKDTTLRDAAAVVSGGLTLFVEWVLKEIGRIGQAPLINWDLFNGPLPRNPPDFIDMTSAPGIAPEGYVEIALQTDQGSHFKQIQYQYWDRGTSRFYKGDSIDNGGNNYLVAKRFPKAAMDYGVLEFVSEVAPNDNRTHYILGDLTKVLKDRTRVTFYWKGP